MKISIHGDWHGNTEFAIAAILDAYENGARHFLHVGDFGIWKGDERYIQGLTEQLEKLDAEIWFVDGNHENFRLLYNIPINKDGMRHVSPRIKHIPRGFRWEWDGKWWMGLGGATSLDRPYRDVGRSWWAEEEITIEDAYVAIQGGKVDYLLTHDCPADVFIPCISANNPDRPNFPQGELDRAQRHRSLLHAVCKEVRPAKLIHGHFHDRYNSTLTYLDGTETEIVGLDSDSDNIKNNYVIIDTTW